MDALVPVPVPCRYGHHDSHQVFLAPTLDLDGGILAEQAIFESKGDINALTRLWLPIFVRHGAKDWDLCDAEGNPTPFDLEALMADWPTVRAVADRASEVYQESIVAPFRERQQTRSPTTPTTPTTSPRPTRTRKSPASR